MFTICKEFTFSAAHSIKKQQLIPELSKNTYPKCTRLPGHGHNYKLTVCISSHSLNGSQMVTDFGNLRWLKEFINTCFDHKLIISMQDRAFMFMMEELGLAREGKLIIPRINDNHADITMHTVDKDYNISRENTVCEQIDMTRYRLITLSEVSIKDTESVKAEFLKRFLEGITLLKPSPTAENMAEFFFLVTQRVLKRVGLKCDSVTIHESIGAWATYRPAN